ncbi:peptidyl-prolyl cis-trans isomerase [Nitrospira sp.]|nr:peptidyl-prolyl cis-trans isomerase [Nitrospira sp.]
MVVSEGLVVSVEYTLRLDDSALVESNVGEAPMTYTHGKQEIISGLERGLEGMRIGEVKRVTVAPQDGYGDIQPEGRFEVSKSRIPDEALRVGVSLQGEGPDGQAVFPRVAEVKDETVVLDLNHPLAGKTLHFDVKVLDIQPSS